MENGSIKAGDPGEASGHESRTAVLRDYWPHWSDCFTMSERRNRLAWEVFFFFYLQPSAILFAFLPIFLRNELEESQRQYT